MLITQVSFHWDILLYLSFCRGYVEHPRYCKLCKLRVRLVQHHARVEPELEQSEPSFCSSGQAKELRLSQRTAQKQFTSGSVPRSRRLSR